MDAGSNVLLGRHEEEEEPPTTLFSLSGVDTALSERDLEEMIASELDIRLSILEKDTDGRTILFMVVRDDGHEEVGLLQGNSDDEQRIIWKFQDYIVSSRNKEAGQEEPMPATAAASWLVDPRCATITRAEMEQEEFVSEGQAYMLWLNGTSDGGTRTFDLAPVPTPDGDLIQPSHGKNAGVYKSGEEGSHELERQQQPSPVQEQLRRDPLLLDMDNVQRVDVSDFSSLPSSWNTPVVLTGALGEHQLEECQQSISLKNVVDKFGDVIVRTGNRETLVENGFNHSEPRLMKDALLPYNIGRNGETFQSDISSHRMVFSPIKELGETFQTDLKWATDNNIVKCVLDDPKYTLCLARQGFGIGMHKHGPAMFCLTEGRKKWYLSPPGPIDDDLRAGRKTHPGFYRSPHACIQNPGEILFVPDQWYHEIFNLDEYTAGVQALANRVCLRIKT